MIGTFDPFALPQQGSVLPPPVVQPQIVPEMKIEPPKKRGGLPMGVINRIQGMFDTNEGSKKSPVKGTSDKLALKPGWGGGQ